jgi:hypothetical protein
LKEAEQLLGSIDRYLRHLQRRISARRRRRNDTQRQAMVAVLRLVQVQTKAPRYAVVGEMLRLLVDPHLTDSTLRKLASRAELPQLRSTRPTLPKRSKSTRGREAGPTRPKKKKEGLDLCAIFRKDDVIDDEVCDKPTETRIPVTVAPGAGPY